jgi:hypothetical protein
VRQVVDLPLSLQDDLRQSLQGVRQWHQRVSPVVYHQHNQQELHLQFLQVNQVMRHRQCRLELHLLYLQENLQFLQQVNHRVDLVLYPVLNLLENPLENPLENHLENHRVNLLLSQVQSLLVSLQAVQHPCRLVNQVVHHRRSHHVHPAVYLLESQVGNRLRCLVENHQVYQVESLQKCLQVNLLVNLRRNHRVYLHQYRRLNLLLLQRLLHPQNLQVNLRGNLL